MALETSLEEAFIAALRQAKHIPPYLAAWLDQNDARRLFYDTIRQAKACRKHRRSRR